MIDDEDGRDADGAYPQQGLAGRGTDHDGAVTVRFFPGALTSLDSIWSTSTFQGDKTLNLSGWVARPSGQALPQGDRGGYGFDAEYPNDLWYADVNYNLFGDALDPALGFLQRPGTKQTSATLTWQPRPGPDSSFSWIRQAFENVGWYYVTGLDDSVQSDDWTFNPVQFTTQGGWHWNLQIGNEYEVLARPYSIVPEVTVPAGSYHFTSVHSNMTSPTADELKHWLAEAASFPASHPASRAARGGLSMPARSAGWPCPRHGHKCTGLTSP